MSPAQVGSEAYVLCSHADLFVNQESTTVEPEVVFEGVSKSPSWTPSYSTAVQGSSPRLESEAILKGDSEPVLDESSTSNDAPATNQGAELVPVPAEPMAVEDVPESVASEDSKPTDEVLAISAPSEQPSGVFGTSLDQARSLDETPIVEDEVEVPPVEKVEAPETPKIVTPVDEEPVEPAAATETPWTRSYSVTSQPGSPRVSPKAELEELEPEPQPVESIQETPVAPQVVDLVDVPKTVVTPAVEDGNEHVAEPAPEEESKPVWTQSYSVTSQPGSPRVSPKQVPEEIPEVEEVKQSWTRSYSVTSQPGSPRILPKEDLSEPTLEPVAVADEPTTVVTPPAEEVAPASAEALERPKTPRTPSYSVTTLEGQAEQVPPEDAVPEPEVVPVPKSSVGEASEPQTEVDPLATDTSALEPLSVGDEKPERPKSPWTPSYSVTTLADSAPAEEPEPQSIADKPSVGVEASAPEPVEAARAVEENPENGTTSDIFEVHEAVAQFAAHGEPQVDVETPEPVPPQLDIVSFTCHCQITYYVLTTTFSPSRMLLTRSRRNPLGLLHTQSHTFRVQARR